MIGSIAIAVFIVAAVLALIRLVRGPALVDRVISLDVMLVALMCAVGTRAAATGDQTYLGILAVIAIVAFTATVVLSRFVERNETGDRT
ncbi:MAG: monovalent cation/H+ antiporter complex subunit F [Actinomycetota bacterium]